jgi:hypothetical protein
MARRRDLFTSLNDESNATMDEVLEHLQLWRSETLETVDLLRAHRQQVESHFNLLENPQAALAYIDVFIDLLGHVASELERVSGALPPRAPGEGAEHPAVLRQIASNAAAEQRRCLAFRDKCINKPLPHEEMRSLLNQISIDTRDQLLDYRDLTLAAARLDALLGNTPASPRTPDASFDRRALFTRFLPRRDQD